MPIKKSSFEKKWFYRVAKVLLLALPVIAAMVALMKGYVNLNFIFQPDPGKVIAANGAVITYAVVSVAVYYMLLSVLWKIFLYIAFGGMIDDTKSVQSKVKASKAKVVTVVSGGGNSDLIGYMKQESQKRGEAILWIILIILFIIIAAYNGSSSIPSPSPTPKRITCIPTGCGNQWRSSCTNKCYTSNSDCRLSGSACNGNVTCRQCP